MTIGDPPLRARTEGALTCWPMVNSLPSRAKWLPAVSTSVLRTRSEAGGRRAGSLRLVERVCESCGREDDDLVAVRPLATSVDDGVELWCPECRARHDHEPAD